MIKLFDETREGHLSASLEPIKVILSRSTLEAGGIELNINQAFSRQWGTVRVDGIFHIKSGGMFQGTVCLGLIPVDEAAILLNPEVEIVELQLGPSLQQ